LLVFLSPVRGPPGSTLFPYTTLFRSGRNGAAPGVEWATLRARAGGGGEAMSELPLSVDDLTVAYQRKPVIWDVELDVTPGSLVRSEEQRLNSSHVKISYAVFCLKKKI